jgi:hypothetical protein
MAEVLGTFFIEGFMILLIEILAFNMLSYWLTDRIVNNTPSMAGYRLMSDPRKAAMMSGIGMVAMIVIVSLYILIPGESELTPETTVLIIASLAVLMISTAWSHRRIRRLLGKGKR